MSLQVEVFDWPSRFLVEAEKPDSEWPKFFKGLEDFDPLAPYLVDLDECREGWCGCRDFAVNVAPFLDDPGHRASCKHIIRAREFKRQMGDKPKKMPSIIKFSLTRDDNKDVDKSNV